MGAKRRRLALSCVDCRKRKVKCDRTSPVCIRCQKSGNADKCTYVSYTGPDDHSLLTPSGDSPEQAGQSQRRDSIDHGLAGFDAAVGQKRPAEPVVEARAPTNDKGQVEALRNRVTELETYVRSAGAKPVSTVMYFGSGNPAGPGYVSEKEYGAENERVMMRGKSFKTQYFGPSFAIGMLMQFDEFGKFVRDVLTTMPSLANAKEKMKIARAASKFMARQPTPYDRDTLQKMIPQREVTDRLVQLYLSNIETTYRILHVPTFMRDYQKYWQSPADAEDDFLAQLLLVMATVFSSVPEGPPGFIGRSSAKREVVTRWINAAEAWVNDQSRKHITLKHFQIYVLAFMAKAMNSIKIKREWASIGGILRHAMAAGMHREPSLLSRKINEFDQEMRKRMWFTILELDLQVSMMRGMPPTIDSLSWDCQPPRNIHDEEFDIDTTELPPSRPRDQFTRTSFLHCANESISLRTEILSRVNNIRIGMDLESAMLYDGKIRKVIDAIPKWVDEGSTATSEIATALTKVWLYEFIVVLHVPFIQQSGNKSRFFHSTASRRDACIKTLQTYMTLDVPTRHLVFTLRDDISRAILSLCYDMIQTIDDDLASPPADKLLPLIYALTESFKDRLLSIGQGFHSFWITSNAYFLVKSKYSPETPVTIFAKEAADRINKIHDSVLEVQVSLPTLDGQATFLTPAIYTCTDVDGSMIADPNTRGLSAQSNYERFRDLVGVHDHHTGGVNTTTTSGGNGASSEAVTLQQPTPTSQNHGQPTLLHGESGSVSNGGGSSGGQLGRTDDREGQGNALDTIFPGFNQTPMFADPFSDFNYVDLSGVWGLDAYDGFMQ